MSNHSPVRRIATNVTSVGLALTIVFGGISGMTQFEPETHYELLAGHSQGNIQMTIVPGGWGYIRAIHDQYDPYVDPITNDSIYGCTYPTGSGNTFTSGSDMFMIGVSDSDTLDLPYLVWTNPLIWDRRWKKQSTDKSQPHYSPRARSDLDIECTFYDTAVYDQDQSYLVVWHQPLRIKVEQRSMAWSGSAVDDFVLFDYGITNIGDQALTDFYVGFYLNDSYDPRDFVPDAENLTGFLEEYPAGYACEYMDTLNLAYKMDNNGDQINNRFTPQSRRGTVGIMLLGSTGKDVRLGYHWSVRYPSTWQDDWGPRRWPTNEEPWHSFDTRFATPWSTQDRYYLCTHPHIAYDQLFAAVDHTAEGWMPPTRLAEMAASGWPSYVYYSFGPFDIGVNEHINFTIAVVGGDNVHTDPLAHFDPNFPQQFYDQLDFSELATNARWAQWVYDNPGYDTDSDGYCGEFRICEGDTIWYKGDGVPDFRGNTPPPAPFTRILTEPSKITIRWNGFFCETTKDPFSNLVDFEGYRVYCGLDTRRASLSILSSYDRENFFRLKWHDLGSGYGKWLNDEPPYSLDELQTIHDDPNFDPHRYTRDYPLFEGDSVFYFQMVDANLDDLSSPLSIHKVYPNATDPGT
ncbi:MAG: hypothetical protein J7J98_03290, partial [candidate division Zixibacteria bacterium]|nr:hypothetical protein [candidate division Zixibacteria bacterium]